MYRATEDAWELLGAAQEMYGERRGAQALTPGSHLPPEGAAQRTGIRSEGFRYHHAIEELEYEGAVEWDLSARFARGTSTTSSPGAAWWCCVDPVEAQAPVRLNPSDVEPSPVA